MQILNPILYYRYDCTELQQLDPLFYKFQIFNKLSCPDWENFVAFVWNNFFVFTYRCQKNRSLYPFGTDRGFLLQILCEIHHIHQLYATPENGMVIIAGKEILDIVRADEAAALIEGDRQRAVAGAQAENFVLVFVMSF